jgi:dienelactone hydrolase
VSPPTHRERKLYELTSWLVPGPIEPIPLLLFQRSDLNGPKPAVVYYHGVTQNKEGYLDSHPTTRLLADNGFVVVLPDAPGHGERPAGAGLIERLRESLPREFCADVEQAGDESPALLDWLAARPEVDPDRLGIIGLSMGGFTAAVVAARVRDRIRAAVCIAGCADLPHCMATTDSIAPGRWGPTDRSIDRETNERIARIDPLGYPDRFAALPLLLLHGSADTWNPVVTSQRFAEQLRPYYAAEPGRFRLAVVPGAPHWPPASMIGRETVEWIVEHVR